MAQVFGLGLSNCMDLVKMNPDDHENTAKEGDVKAVKAMSKKGLSTVQQNFAFLIIYQKLGLSIGWLSISLPSPDTFPSNLD